MSVFEDTESKIKIKITSVKAEVNLFPDPHFLFFVPQNTNCYKHKIKCGRISASIKWRHLGHLQLLSKAKHPLTAMVEKEVCPRDEIANPPGTAVLPIGRHGFAEGLVYFCTLCGMQSSLVRFSPNRAIAWGPPQCQAPLETLCFLSASVFYILYSGIMNELHRCPGRNVLWCAEDGGRGV